MTTSYGRIENGSLRFTYGGSRGEGERDPALVMVPRSSTSTGLALPTDHLTERNAFRADLARFSAQATGYFSVFDTSALG